MNRRTLLVGTGVTATSVLGGCLSNDNESDSSENPENPEGSTANDEALNEAYDHLETAGNEFETQADVAFETEPENPLSTGGIETALNDAESALDDVNEDEASAEQLDRLENAEYALAFFEDGLSVLIKLEEGFNAWKTADSYETNDRHSDAADQVKTAAKYFREAESLVSDAKASWDELNAEQFEGNDVELATGSDDLDYLEDLCNAYARFSEATTDLFTGLEYFVEGANLFDQERFSAAVSAFEDAANSFEAANSKYREAETEVPQSFQKEFIDQTCRTDAVLEASNLFTEASEAAAEGDWETAEEKANNAETALDVSCGGETL